MMMVSPTICCDQYSMGYLLPGAGGNLLAVIEEAGKVGNVAETGSSPFVPSDMTSHYATVMLLA